jgi:hypothetical protein
VGVTEQRLSVGLIVHYRLSDEDLRKLSARSLIAGNQPHVGDVYPAVILRVNGELSVNLRVLLDGPDDVWLTSRNYSVETNGCWFWPPKVGA